MSVIGGLDDLSCNACPDLLATYYQRDINNFAALISSVRLQEVSVPGCRVNRRGPVHFWFTEAVNCIVHIGLLFVFILSLSIGFT
jgi:hypothetical protein